MILKNFIKKDYGLINIFCSYMENEILWKKKINFIWKLGMIQYMKFFKRKEVFFFEISVYDEKYLFNIFWLERKYDWIGFLIERNLDLCKRIDKLERNVWRLCVCLLYFLKSVVKSSDEVGIEVYIECYMKNLDKNKNVS